LETLKNLKNCRVWELKKKNVIVNIQSQFKNVLKMVFIRIAQNALKNMYQTLTQKELRNQK